MRSRIACFGLLLALGCALPGAARAQLLRSCLDDSLPAAARVQNCTRVVAANRDGPNRALALFGRAQARMELVDESAGDPPPAAYDPMLADLDESWRTFQNEQALSLRVVVRFYRREIAPAAWPLFRGGAWEQAVALLGPMIAAAPGDADLLLLRATFRRLTGDGTGAEQDRVQALRIVNRVP